MGRTRRQQPARLASKLRELRLKLGLTQDQMAKRLCAVRAGLQPGHIAEFELARREPSLPLLLAYAKLAGISTDLLIDDELDLPDHLSGLTK